MRQSRYKKSLYKVKTPTLLNFFHLASETHPAGFPGIGEQENPSFSDQKERERVFLSQKTSGQTLYGCFCVWILLTIFIFSVTGCHHRKRDPDPVPDDHVSSGVQIPDRTDEKPDRPEPVQGLTADKLLRQMTDVYSKAKFYQDCAYIEAVYQVEHDGKPEQVSHRIPCSVIFEKPNYLRMEVNHGLLCSDGERIKAKILEPGYLTEYMETPSPLVLGSVRPLYPDIRLANAMDMEVPSSVFWVPPQLILLLSEEPLRTFLPKNSQVALMDPAYLDLENRDTESGDGKNQYQDDRNNTGYHVACDRVKIQTISGTRILWIARETNALVRFEFPLEGLEVPENVNQVISLNMEFPDQVISEEIPEEKPDSSVFQMDLKELASRFHQSRPIQEEKVEHFLPVELRLLGQNIPEMTLRPLVSGFSDISPDKADRYQVFCFWTGWGEDSRTASHNQMFFNEFEQLARYNVEHDIDFIAVNIDPPEIDDSKVRSDYGAMNHTVPLYRASLSEIRQSLLSNIVSPSILMVDRKGVIQKYYQTPVSFLQLQRNVARLLNDENLYQDDFNIFNVQTQRFLQSIDQSERADMYAVDSTLLSDEPPVVLPQRLPTAIRMKELWKVSALKNPGNPIAFSPGETGEDRIIVPCEGNALAILNSEGKVLQTIVPKTAADEPITFVRTVDMGEGKRFFAASALLESQKIHRFDENFNDLGTLDVGKYLGQWVTDVRFADINQDKIPEMILALAGDSTSSQIPVHGVYAVDMKTQKIYWKDEMVLAPYQIGVIHSSGGTADPMLLAMNHSEGGAGSLIEDRISDGSRINEMFVAEHESVIWFAAADLQHNGETNIAILLRDVNSPTLYFSGISQDGNTLWKTPIPLSVQGRQMERIVTGDIDNDNVDEWILPMADGTIYLFNLDGQLIESFNYGSELTGICVVKWNGEPCLIVTDTENITAWKLGKK